MAESRHEVSREPIHRRPEDQNQDFEQIFKNMEHYQDWPNDAGFLGLQEEKGPIEIVVSGSIPEWVQGSLYRTGPGVYDIEDTPKGTFRTSHWFDGLAQTHRFDIKVADDKTVKVFYSSRRQCDALIEQIRKTGTRGSYTFAQRSDPCLGIYGKFMAAWHALRPDPTRRPSENVNVAVQLDMPGLDAISGNLLDGSYLKNGAKQPEPKKATIATVGHRSGEPAAVWVLSDTSAMKQIDPTTMEPIGFARQTALHQELKGQLSCAHGHRDPKTGDYFNWNEEMGKETTYRIFRVNASTGKTDILATLQGSGVKPAYIHSFFLSDRFVILSIPSSHLTWSGISVAWNRNILDAIEPFDKSKKTKSFVIDRRHGKGVVAEFETDASFFFHTVNAFEDRDEQDMKDGTVSLFCDVVEYESTDVMYGLYMDIILNRNGETDKHWDRPNIVEKANPHLVRQRVRVPLPENAAVRANPATKGRKVPIIKAEKVVNIAGPHSGELPTINPNYATKRTRYCYSLASRGMSTLVDSLIKTDMDTGEMIMWNNSKGHTPGEGIFVPRPGSIEEDDGVLLSVVLDGKARSSYLVCLDARTMKELGRADVGFAVGLGFHGAHNKL